MVGKAKEKGPSTKLIKPRTKAGIRSLEKRAPKLIENPRRALLLYGQRTSQVVKDVITDIHKLKGVDAFKYHRKNDDVRPFESGGEVFLEQHGGRADCSLFALGSHSKKRPHNLVLGRLYDGRLYDAVEFGVAEYKPIRGFSAATLAQLGNKPCFVFVGEAFENDSGMRQVRSLMLDFFRGRQVEHINLKGLDRVVFVTYSEPAASADPAVTALGKRTVLFRQYAVQYKKSGTRVPRVVLQEMGPRLNLQVRRSRAAPVELEKEACRKPKLHAKKQKNVGTDMLDGKVGRMYMPKQDVDSMALRKMKGLKRERRAAAAAAGDGADAGGKRQRGSSDGDGE